jgi:hypothetical protein
MLLFKTNQRISQNRIGYVKFHMDKKSISPTDAKEDKTVNLKIKRIKKYLTLLHIMLEHYSQTKN